jgi:hypothetical protein
MRLTGKQLAALRAVAGKQRAIQSRLWWDTARASWQGPRKTLGSLIARDLVDYDDATGWTLTDKGREVLAELAGEGS